MRYGIGNIVLLTITITHFASASWPTTLKDGNFFLYNRRSKPIYYALSVGNVELTQFVRINAQRCSPYIPVGVDQEVHVYLALDVEPKKGDTIDHYIFRPGTFNFIHLKVMPESSDWHNVLRDSEKEIVRDGYVLRMYTNYNPTIATITRAWSVRDEPMVEHITYNGDQKQDRLEQLKAMTVDQLEERLSTIATLLGVLHVRKNADSESACKQLEQERAWIRNLLAHYYHK